MENKAGESTRKMMNDRKKRGIIAGIVGMLVIAFLWWLWTNGTRIGLSGTALFAVLLLLAIARNLSDGITSRIFRTAHRARRGAIGEETIGALLESIPGEKRLMHDIPCPNGNIDHIVLLPSGQLFLIETKAHRGKVRWDGAALLVNGRPTEKDFIAQTLRNTMWLANQAKQLAGQDVWVTPLIVFSNAFVPSIAPIRGIRVINKGSLQAAIRTTHQTNPNNLWLLQDDLHKALYDPTP